LKSRFRTIAAVEIGTSKIVVLVGLVAGNGINIIGVGEAPSLGVVKGVITDSPAASEAVHQALIAAEKNAEAKIQQVFLAQSGTHIDGFYHEACINIGGLGGRVSQRDLASVFHLARQKDLPPERCVIHFLQHGYHLDGARVEAPELMRGDRLSLGLWTVHADHRRVHDGINIFTDFGLPVTQVVLSGMASGEIVTTEDERRHGALVVDIGAGTTDYVYYKHGHVIIAGVLPVGGNHFTNDLSLALHLTTAEAEGIKHRYGRANVTARDRASRVFLHGDLGVGDLDMSRMSIEQVTAARAEELLEVVRKKLGLYYIPSDVLAGVILTGGASRLPGMEAVAARVFEVPTRMGTHGAYISEALRNERYSTALGLLHVGLRQQVADEDGHRSLPAKLWMGLVKFWGK
jgi:cell division protein FtsA